MAQTVGAPAPQLRPYVRCYFGFSVPTAVSVRLVEGPGIDVLVLLSFGTRWRIRPAIDAASAGDLRASFVAGLHDHAVLTENDGRVDGMQISLTPLGAYALFGIPMDELARRTIPLDDVFAKGSLVSVDRLADAPDWQARFSLLDDALSTRLRDGSPPSPEMRWVWSCLVASRGTVAITRLADELGWTRRRLIARFRTEVGLPPKTVARMIRFEQAAPLVAAPGPKSLARIAAECGFYDQSHLTQEFHRIAGMTPTAYANARTNFQDGVPAAS